MTRICASFIPVTGLFLVLFACGEEKPPAPPAADAPAQGSSEAAPGPVTWDGQSAAVLTYAGDRGVFADAKSPDEVPEEARGLVRVTLLDGPAPPPSEVFVTNLRQPGEGGTFALRTVPRDLFEELAAGEGRSSQVTLPEGLEPPKVVPRGGIVVYKTSWCGVCKKLEGYLKRKGVTYEAKDIEADREAAAELAAKAKEAGIKTNSVPVIDVRGELLVGFDRKRLEALL